VEREDEPQVGRKAISVEPGFEKIVVMPPTPHDLERRLANSPGRLRPVLRLHDGHRTATREII
jgi:hypothetical protein